VVLNAATRHGARYVVKERNVAGDMLAHARYR
jgi:hypothetical protein